MSKAPKRCPMCGNRATWKKVDTSRKGFSAGKAAAGAIIFGPVGLAGGALGKKMVCYCCGECGFCHEYKA